MKAVIFAGGMGTRISEESHLKPKPMIEIGDKPILWHIMKIFSSQGINDFVICLGYKGYMIKEYFFNYFLHNSDVTIELKDNKVSVHNTNAEDIKVTLVETGLSTKTAGRLKRVKDHLQGEDFMLTYGDGLADINLKALVDYHKAHGKIASVTAIQPLGRFGVMQINNDNSVDVFKEKARDDEGWINGGFFVLKPDVFNYLPANADEIMWEDLPIQNLAKDDQLMAFQHHGFWKCMDALRDKIELEEIWNSGSAKWKTW
ncbi:MAG TPA: glucose-1-phosphate cytidylyltransferase [Puia sp.]|jgi:glucose-1-phosphate cytidylyltransferase|nr:glucose-1-phosphate cytidylyltransferase [Puia sp.]